MYRTARRCSAARNCARQLDMADWLMPVLRRETVWKEPEARKAKAEVTFTATGSAWLRPVRLCRSAPSSRHSAAIAARSRRHRRSACSSLSSRKEQRTRWVAMVKLFIGNLPREATEQEIRSLFEQYGKVLECDIIKNYGFVHIEDKTAAEDAIRNLHHHKLHGVCINVEASKNKSKASTKLHVGNISPACTNLELRAKFEEYGPVIECDIVKDYAFVHMERAEDAVEAIRGLDNTEFQGKRMRVQLSTSRLRTVPGMGDKSSCYRCGKEGHWSKECPVDRPGQVADFAEAYNEQYGAVRTPYTAGYGETVYYDEAYGGMADYYKRYRVRSYATASAYDAYAEQTMAQYSQYAQYSQVQSSAMAATTAMAGRIPTTLDAYDRALLPTPGAAAAVAAAAATAAAAAASSTYYTRDRSPLRRTAAAASTVGEAYTYERGQLSPVSSVARASLYDLQRFERDPYGDRARYSAF